MPGPGRLPRREAPSPTPMEVYGRPCFLGREFVSGLWFAATPTQETFLGRGGAATCLSRRPQKAKFTFLRCAIFLNWEFRKQLFSKLAWGHGLGAESDIFMCMVRGQRPPRGGAGCGMVDAGGAQSGSSGSRLTLVPTAGGTRMGAMSLGPAGVD